MKKTIRSIKALLASGLMLTGLLGNAQQYPFPVEVNYTYGIMPTSKSSADAKAAYNAWKAAYVVDVTCNSVAMKRVTFDDPGNSYTTGSKADVSVSEGIGYGLLLTAYHGDKTVFDGLWAYYKLNMNGNKVMNWIINGCSTPLKPNGATDAELDAAMALIVAHYQWDNSVTTTPYLDAAKALISAIKSKEIESSTKVLRPGDAFGGTGINPDAYNIVNPSYFSPAYYRVFGDVTNDAAFWDGVATKGYQIINQAKNANTGLVPDWCQGTNGVSPAADAIKLKYQFDGGQFYYDAVRTPFRTALDYLWHGTPEALAYCKTVNAWLQTAHPSPSSVGARYTLDGQKQDASHNNTFVGCFAAATMATDQPTTANKNYTNAFYAENKTVTPGASQYFNASWKALSLLLQTGNFYLPPPDACESPVLLNSYSLCKGSPQLLDGGVTGDSYIWKLNGQQVATTQTYNATLPGTYELTVTVSLNGKPCIRRTSTEVYQATPKADFSFVVSGLGATFTDLSLGGIKTYAWNFGANGGATASIANPVTSYSAPGLKLVTLTVTNACSQTSTITKELTVGNANSTADGWYATNFTGNLALTSPGSWVYIAPNLETAAPANSITIDGVSGSAAAGYTVDASIMNCKYAVARFLTTTTQYSSVGITFKNPIKNPSSATYNNYLMNIKDYPYVRFRVKVDQAVDSLRVDLLDGKFKSTSYKPVYLKGERNADGTYKPIPVNQWFVATLDFTGRFSYYGTATKAKGGPVDSTQIGQLNFYPYAQYGTATGRKAFNLSIDWVIAGNQQYPGPDLAAVVATATICPSAIGITKIGFTGDTCTLDADNILWSTGEKTPSIAPPAAGKYTVTVSNYGGTVSKDITVTVPQNSKAGFSYTTPAVNTVQVSDGSVGPSASYKWYRYPIDATLPAVTQWSTAYLLVSGQQPAPFVGTNGVGTAQTPYVWADGDRICQQLSTSLCHVVSTDRGSCQTITIVITGLEELNATTTNVYPTVADDHLNIMLGGSLSGSFEVNISDILGTSQTNLTIGAGLSSINVASLPLGTYIVKVSQGGKTITKKFIKQ